MNPISFIEMLKHAGIKFFSGVPDSLLKDFCAALSESVSPSQHVTAANEGGAVALAAGHYLGSGSPALVYMQNSGQGNALNPLLSLTDPRIYGIPLILLVGWRGEPGTQDEPQHQKQGEKTCEIFDTISIPYEILSNDISHAKKQVECGITLAVERQQPFALLVRAKTFDAFTSAKASLVSPNLSEKRETIIKKFLDCIPKNAIVVATTGHISRELYECREDRKEGHARDFLTVGSMGHAVQIAMGLALTHPELPVFCLDGDGAALMHMGALAIVGQSSCRNLHHLLLNNGAHGSVGGQSTVGLDIDFSMIAQACGYAYVGPSFLTGELDTVLRQFVDSSGPSFLECRTGIAHRKDLGRPKTSPTENKESLMKVLQEVR